MNNFRLTTRWLTAFTLTFSVLLLPILSIPTCCCASSISAASESKCCCCQVPDNSRQSQCCATSSTSVESDDTGCCCEGVCRCGDASANSAIVRLSKRGQRVLVPLVTLLDWNFVPANYQSASAGKSFSPATARSHNVRQSLLAVWLK